MNNLFKIVLLSTTVCVTYNNNSYCMESLPSKSYNNTSETNTINSITSTEPNSNNKEEINKTDMKTPVTEWSKMLANKIETINKCKDAYNAFNKSFKDSKLNTKYSLDTITNKQGINLEPYLKQETNTLQNIITSANDENINEQGNKYLAVLKNIISVLENISDDYKNHIIYGIIQDTKSRLKKKIERKEYFDKLYVAEKLTLSSLKQFHMISVMRPMNQFIEACNALNNELLIIVLPHVLVYGLNKFLHDYLKTLQNISPDDYTRRKKHMKQLLKETVHANTSDEFCKKEACKYASNIFHAL